jgi:hypothetical protein
MLSRSVKRKMRSARHTGRCRPVTAWDQQNKRKCLPFAPAWSSSPALPSALRFYFGALSRLAH